MFNALSNFRKSHKLSARRNLIDLLEPRVLLSGNQTLTVTTTAASGAGSLAAAIQSANSYNQGSTTIEFDPTAFASAQTITLTGTALDLTNTAESITITGPAAGVTLNANQLSGVFTIASGVTSSMTNLGITGGTTSGITNSGALTLSNDLISGNANVNLATIGENPAPDGGGIDNLGSISLTNCNISNNSYVNPGNGGVNHDGGGLYNSGTATISNCIFSNNSISDAISDTVGGGAIYNGGTAIITDTTIDHNGHVTAAGGQEVGGGIYNAGNLTATADAITNNISYNDAGGIENTGTATFTNCTIAGNFAEETCGGIENSSGSLSLFDDTISQNSGGTGEDGLAVNGGNVVLANTIIAGNIVQTQTSDANTVDVAGTVVSNGHNLIGVGDGANGLLASDYAGTAANPLNADLDPLANYGGPTDTMPPAGGPASGTGSVSLIPNGITTDQRGLPRTVNGTVDIGAVEQQSGLTIANIPSLLNVGAGGIEAFTVSVDNTSGSEADNVSVSDPVPSALTYASANPSVGTYDSTTGLWTIGTLASGATAFLTLNTTAGATTGPVTDSATVTTTATNDNSRINVASQALTILPAAPTLGDDLYNMFENQTLSVPALTGVLANDTASGTIAIISNTMPADGTLSFDQNDGSFTYTPNNGFSGSDSFTYTAIVTPNGAPSTANVTIAVISPSSLTPTTTSLTTSYPTAGQGDTVTLTATVSNGAVFSPIQLATGTVTFTALPSGTVLGEATLAPVNPLSSPGVIELVPNDVATLTTTSIPADTASVTATYVGDFLNATSTSTAISQTATAYSTPVAVGIVNHKQHKMTPITLANGTSIDVIISGGSGTVATAGNNVELTLGSKANVTIKATGGSGTFDLSTVTTGGPIRSFVAPGADVVGKFTDGYALGPISDLKLGTVDGTVFVAGNVAHLTTTSITTTGIVAISGGLANASLGNVAGRVSAAKLGHITANSLAAAKILAGPVYNTLDTNLLGDQYFSAQLISLKVTGDVTDSIIAAGVNPGTDGVFGTSDDALVSGTDKIGSILIKGTLDSATKFEAFTFPKTVRTPKLTKTARNAQFVKPTGTA